MERLFIRLGAVAAFLGVAFGAFGAHMMRAQLSATHFAAFETGVHYQLVHALALVLVGVLLGRQPSRMMSAAGWCFAIGIVLFSGSLYALTITGTTAFGMLTPLGGLFFLAGWVSLGLAAPRA